jgi:hypothetical protein
MNLIQLLQEFIQLGYQETKNGPEKDIDRQIGELTVGRMNSSGYLVYYLYSGTSLLIPWKWIDLFQKFSENHGNRVLHEKQKNIQDDPSKIIYLMTRFCQNFIEKADALNTLGDICEIGTKELRKIFPELPPFEYSDVNRQIEI